MPAYNLLQFSHEAALRAWHKFLGFVPGKECNDASKSNKTAGSILPLARFDALSPPLCSSFEKMVQTRSVFKSASFFVDIALRYATIEIYDLFQKR